MKLAYIVSIFLLLYSGTSFANNTAIKQKLIAESIAGYSGNCPCPYNSARNGSSCGRRSAYSRAGGYAPLCYEKDVTQEMVNEYTRIRGQFTN
jgi:hypothetical protein